MMVSTSAEHHEGLILKSMALLEAFRESVQDVRKRYMAQGDLMPGWKDGRVVWVDPVTLQEATGDPTVESSVGKN